MITTQPKSDFFDEVLQDVTIRHYGDTHISGYLSAINFTPAFKEFSDVLTTDVVVTKPPPFIAGCNYRFDYDGVDRLATRVGFGLGEYRHIHL